MTSFNSLPALSSGASAANVHALGGHGGHGQGHSMGMGMGMGAGMSGINMSMDMFDPDLGFDDALIDSTNASANGSGLSGLPFTPTAYDFEAFSSTFEDPFSYQVRPYDVVAMADAEAGPFQDESASPQELDNKLLGFGLPIPGKATLVDETARFAEPNMTAELYGMFFVAEDVFGGENTGRPLELTCYRRNLWQCSGQITLPRHIAHCVNDQGRQIPVVDLSASITAIESIEGKPTEIISIPWKSSAPAPGGTTAGDETKVAAAPPNVPLDLSSGQELDGNRISVPVSWKRLQFKHATANNGRRKGLQQHYVVQIGLLARTGTGEDIKIAEIQSGPVIVRGRSPRNFDSRKDVPLTGDKKPERKSTEPSASTSVSASSSGTGGSAGAGGSNSKQQRQDLAQNLQRYHSLGNVQQSNDWATPQPFPSPTSTQQHTNKKMAVSPNLTRPPVPSWASSDGIGASSGSGSRSKFPDLSTPVVSLPPKQWASTAVPTLPISLSLSEDERSPNKSSTSGADMMQGGSPHSNKSMKAAKGGGKTQTQRQSESSPLETADMLYEYFPLSLDDWMPPVDAIYRPHVVHHTIVPPEVKAQQTKSKTKRYFAAE
ncbi:hypothetical protein B0T22DRAFT_287189 [Podospora appendiculata]|uniref:NDT80 domain-containing protein n=1 Tax=Podospora appendiculata TaxID=314037 RepID=A0AAE0X1K5_9PEZI|nr:hypothetical protein B0T22DRAFT_287189 [Podospora appendiculata]